MLKLFSISVAMGLGAVAMAAAQGGGAQPPAAAAAPTLKVGDQAPPFALPGSDGKIHKLADYKGKTVVLAWFPKAFTGG